MEISLRTYVLNVALAFVPDLAVAWAAARITDTGWQGFLVTLLVLQSIYFFFWAKQAAWSWLLFWLFGKERMARYLHGFFSESRFPAPSTFAKDLDDYLPEMIDNAALETSTRIKAAFEAGTLNGLKIARRYSAVMQLNSAAAQAMRQYRRVAKPAPEDESLTTRKSGIVSLEMRHSDPATIAWLADCGFRVWTYPLRNEFRPGAQVPHREAELLARVLDQFERKIVPDLLGESEEEKQSCFSQHENRLQTIWDSYPAQAR